MRGDLILRCDPSSTVWYDAYDAFRINLEDGALATLMAYPPMKEDIRNDSRLEHGTRHTDINPRVAEREFAIPIHLVAKKGDDYFGYYKQFMYFLRNGWIDIWVKALNPSHASPTANDTIFRCKYRSCNQFRQYFGKVAVYSLSLVEYNPNDRALDTSSTQVKMSYP